MAYGDSYSAVQSASLAEKQMSNGIVNTLIGVLQNRKQLQQQQEQFDQNHALALMQHRKLQEENDWKRTIDEKKLQADAADLDFKKSIQAFNEKNLIEGRDIDWAKLGNEEDKTAEASRANEIKQQGFRFDADLTNRQQNQNEIADYEKKMERYNYAQNFASAQNKLDDLTRLKERTEKAHTFWTSDGDSVIGDDGKPVMANGEPLTFGNLKKSIASITERKQRIKNADELTVFSDSSSRYVPIVPVPQMPNALRTANDTESNSDSGSGYNPLLRGSAPPEVSGSAVSNPAQAPAQGDPRIAIYTQLVSSGMPDREAISEADRRYKAMLNQARYGGPSGF